MLRYCANLKAIGYELTSLNRIVADKSDRVIVAWWLWSKYTQQWTLLDHLLFCIAAQWYIHNGKYNICAIVMSMLVRNDHIRLTPETYSPSSPLNDTDLSIFKLRLHDAIYRLRFYSSSLIRILSLSNSHNNAASLKRNRADKSHPVTNCNLRLQLHGAIYRPDSFILVLRYCANLKAIRYESTSLNRMIADKSHRVIVAVKLVIQFLLIRFLNRVFSVFQEVWKDKLYKWT